MTASQRLFLPFATFVGLVVVALPYLSSLLDAAVWSEERSWHSVMLLSVAILSILRFVVYVRNASLLKFPGPVPLPLIGNMMSFIAKGTVQESLRALVNTYGNIIDLLLVEGKRVVLVNDGSVCKVVMKSMDRGDLSLEADGTWTKPFRETFLWKDMWGVHEMDMFSRTHQFLGWKAHRRLLQPAFDQKHVRAMTQKLETCAKQLVNRIDTGVTIDALPLLQQYGLEMIHSATLGTGIDSLPDKGRFLVEFFTETQRQFVNYAYDPFLYLTVNVLPYIGLNKGELERRKNVPIVRQYCRDLLEQEQKRQQEQQADTGEEGKGAVDNLLSILVATTMEKDNPFTIDNALDELLSFIFAGYDTTATTLGNLLYHLATHPSAQQKVHEELDRVAKSSKSTSFADMIQELHYLSACIRESQRLQPAAPMLQRRIHESVPLSPQVKNGTKTKATLEKGTVVVVPSFLLHRDPQIYPDPEAFRPERWLKSSDNNDATLVSPTPGYFYAFGAGPKMCVGFQLAEKEVKMAAASIFQEFSVASRGEHKIVDLFVTGPEKVLVECTKRIV